MEIKSLLGNRLYLEMPEEPKSSIHLDAESKAALEAEQMKKWGRLRVYAVGEGAKEVFNEGDEIMIDPTAASKVLKIHLSEERTVLLVSSLDVAHIW